MVRMRSQTSVANSGIKEATTYSYIVFCAEILRVANWASTWTNQMWGSAGQKGGNLMLVAAMVTGLPSAGVRDGRSSLSDRADFEASMEACVWVTNYRV